MLLLTVPASCEVIKPIIIEDAANVGAVDITLTCIDVCDHRRSRWGF